MTEQKGSESFTIKKDTLWKGAVAVLVVIIIVMAFGKFGGNNANPDNSDDSIDLSNIDISITDKDPILGNVNAAVSIVEFSDFECPFCARAAYGPVSDFKNSAYFKDGDVNLVYKQYPLPASLHPNAYTSAIAAECAMNQGNDKFWKYHDLLFANQAKLDVASLKIYAEQAGLNIATFGKCLDNQETADNVASDMADAENALGNIGTPTFVVINNNNGKAAVVSGAVPYTSRSGPNSPMGLEQAIGLVG